MQQLLDPSILFFCLGIGAGLVRSNLEIPPAISRFLALYLLMALGLKGGFALSRSGVTPEVLKGLATAVLLAVTVPVVSYIILRKSLNGFDAAAIAATYGSVSAVTFITAVQFLDTQGIAYGGHMAAAMALMESPAIILAVVFANLTRRREGASKSDARLGATLREAVTDGSQLLLLGAMLVGAITGAHGEALMKPFAGDLLKGMLAFFLLDMGLFCARGMSNLSGVPRWLLAYAIGAPIVHAAFALVLSSSLDLSLGDTALLMVLAASASYIAVPAVVRHAIPEARGTLYLGLSLGLTFPFNLLIGIPLYVSVAQRGLP